MFFPHESPYCASPCPDVDECQTGVHRCGDGQTCQNLPGTYRCECQPGYQYDMFRKMCVGMYSRRGHDDDELKNVHGHLTCIIKHTTLLHPDKLTG